MGYQITIGDYSSDWALMDRAQDPRTKPGYLSREEVIDFYGSLGIHGVELNHSYWYDYTPAQLRRLTADAGLSIVAYTVFIDLAVPSRDRPRGSRTIPSFSAPCFPISVATPLVVRSWRCG